MTNTKYTCATNILERRRRYQYLEKMNDGIRLGAQNLGYPASANEIGVAKNIYNLLTALKKHFIPQ
jgi:hypothetical protein